MPSKFVSQLLGECVLQVVTELSPEALEKADPQQVSDQDRPGVATYGASLGLRNVLRSCSRGSGHSSCYHVAVFCSHTGFESKDYGTVMAVNSQASKPRN